MSSKSATPALGVAYKITGADSDAKLETLTKDKEYNGYKATLVSGNGTATPGTDDTLNGVKVDDKAAVVIYTSEGRSKLVTGKQYKNLADADVTKSTAVFQKKSNGLDRVQMAAVEVPVGKFDASGSSSDHYAYIVTAAYENDGNLYYTIWDGEKNVDVIEKNNTTTSERAKGTLIGYSAIDNDKVITDVTDYNSVKDATAVTNNNSIDKGTAVRGGNESTDPKFITVNGRKFKITADTTVLRVDSDADKDADIGQAYTYGTTTMTKAQKNTDGKFTTNVWFILDENAGTGDDKDIDVLVIDSTGAFKGYKVADAADDNKTEKGDYTTKYATVNTEDKAVVTGAASDLSTDGTLSVDLQFNPKAVSKATITVKVNDVDKTADVMVGSKKLTALNAFSGKVTLKLAGVRDDAKVVVNVTNITDATVNVGVAAKTAGTVDGDTAATIDAVAAAPKKVGETVKITVASATTVQKDSTYVLTYNTDKTLEATASKDGEVTFTYTVTVADVMAGNPITLTATKIAAKP